jgi:hypothetical protein
VMRLLLLAVQSTAAILEVLRAIAVGLGLW